MKKLISNYTFNPTAKKVTFSDYTSISLERVLLITNVTINEIIYSFADPAKGGSVSGNVLTLDYDTTGMSSTDKLQIWYEDVELPATESGNLNDLLQLLKMLIQSTLGRLAIDASNRLRVLDENKTATFLSASSGTNVATGGAPTISSGTWQLVWIGPIDQRWEMIQRANIEYNECQRSKFTFT
jgi:hypothetical protein